MKAQIIEHRGCFEITLRAEDMKESVQITRLGMGATKEMRRIGAYASEDKEPLASLVVGKYKNMSNEVKRSSR